MYILSGYKTRKLKKIYRLLTEIKKEIELGLINNSLYKDISEEIKLRKRAINY
jgi:hypothetical protein